MDATRKELIIDIGFAILLMDNFLNVYQIIVCIPNVCCT